jgi:hypothetical protein
MRWKSLQLEIIGEPRLGKPEEEFRNALAKMRAIGNVRYPVFKQLQVGKSGEACVVVNFATMPQAVDAGLDGLLGKVDVATSFPSRPVRNLAGSAHDPSASARPWW